MEREPLLIEEPEESTSSGQEREQNRFRKLLKRFQQIQPILLTFMLLAIVGLSVFLVHERMTVQRLQNSNSDFRKQIQALQVHDNLVIEKMQRIYRENENFQQKYGPIPVRGMNAEYPLKPKTVYLTFDDGPSEVTPAILETLAQHNVKATFFVTGNETPFGKEMYRRIVREGHAIGNHTFSHKYSLIYASADRFMEEVKRLDGLVAQETGVHTDILRFPGGSNFNGSLGIDFMRQLSRRCIDEGYDYFDWNVDSKDSEKPVQSKEVITSSVKEQVSNKNTAVILFHDLSAKKTTVEALPEIIEHLKSQGYTFEVLRKGAYSVKFI
ncbi:polysaccharide deacetylase family protein [Heliobacillus mobilis]|uniref:Polysaccharide deacetylase family protein n=1 Tax=Heliobacterium mobile TaxID=28064 RepID=A0A6I3SG65_HELMO|nr:polysaccharide deacetylase family protein [Heliobacterium mobile]MTV47844.1 polysaccharide deacetylase family protein [Heliobacterium mobile]